MSQKIPYPTKYEEFSLPILKSLTCLKAGGLEEVVILNVIEPESLLIIRESGLPFDFEQIRNYAQKKIDSYTTKVVEGSLVPEILKAADIEDVSLIVAGRQKRDLFGELFVGSTTDRITRKSAVPVLVAKFHVITETEGRPDKQYCANMFRKILYPTDWSASAVRAKHYLPGLHKVGASEIIIVHVMEDVLVASELSSIVMDELRKTNEAALNALKQEFEQEGFTVNVLLLNGKPSQEIKLVATEQDVSLIVMGSHGKGFTGSIFWGSVSQRVVEYSEKPVLVVK